MTSKKTMLFASPRTNAGCGNLVTPVTSTKYNLKPPSRKLWQKENLNIDNEKWRKYRIEEEDKWDQLESPQFVDFSNIPESRDSFFNKPRVIVSTPIPGSKGIFPSTSKEDSLITSLNTFSLSGINDISPKIQCNNSGQESEENESFVKHDTIIKMENDEKGKCNKVKKAQSNAVYPFKFDLRQKLKEEEKQERLNKILEEEKKTRVFRANPVPKYLKTRSLPATTNKNINNNVGRNNCNTSDNDQKLQATTKNIKRNIEIWKKPPFIPCRTRKNSSRPKTPLLQTAIRAQERKRFDEILREKEIQRQQQSLKEIIVKQKEQEKEIAILRKQTVHKAQPIRKYKTGLPEIQKRPLTDPKSPISKRRRIGTENVIKIDRVNSNV
ncbi:PREDICTED: targeting protein for Xklp2-B-like [Dufourea novaeangliae]|uniref:targeting protein for Xklp2-B-like n=1 Tax=Dufourea novaeangliae TaxID=178035 RepID=UPI00076720B5|nr:PREDICTED: targeting protein for Xklp2-B-like [Dufourea novaeangliae]